MENKTKRQPFLPLAIIFFLVSIILLVLKAVMDRPGVEYNVLLTGNAILFLATLLSFNLYRKALQNNNVQFFLRMIYSGMFLKMIICIAAALVYILTTATAVSKIAIFGCFGLYFIYTFVEVKILMRLSKQQKNA